jgi:hypothetical protein
MDDALVYVLILGTLVMVALWHHLAELSQAAALAQVGLPPAADGATVLAVVLGTFLGWLTLDR